MRKYVDHSKADKARRKGLIVIGTMPKAKAKAFVKRENRVEIYGEYPGNICDIGFRPMTNSLYNDRLMELIKERIAKEVA